MPEQFDPVTLSNFGGVSLDQNYFNRLEAAHELADDRATALENGIKTPISLNYAAVVTPDAAQGSSFRCVATGNLTLNAPLVGRPGQTITVRIKASGADRTVSFEGGLAAAEVIPSGNWRKIEMTYDQPDDTWIIES